MTSSDLAFAACAIFAVTLSGLGKGGFAGLGALALPVLALSISPVRAAAILLPILVVQDTVGLWAFRRHWDRSILSTMFPGMVLGIALGYLLAAMVNDRAVEAVVGAISICFGSYRLWSDRNGSSKLFANLPDWMGAIFGVASGFTSQVAHAGGPPFQMWVIPKRLPRDVLIGTTAVAFAGMNLIKIPAYIALGQLTATNLKASAMLLPVALMSTAGGIVLVRKIHAERFYTLIYLLMILLGVFLLGTSMAI